MGNKQSSQQSESRADSTPPESTRVPEAAESSANSSGNPSYYTLIKNSYQQLVNAIIRPPRCKYSIEQLGPREFAYCGKKFHRIDFSLTNPRNLKFECSLWEPTPDCRPSERLPCVIYMHGNSSARIEALSCLSVILGMGATVLAIDFAGSGLSEGEYVSLGAFEKDDLAAAIEYLRNNNKTSTIALWGRSMGAATALLHAERDPSIAGMILDSAFSDLVVLAEDMVEKGRQQGLFAPSFLVYVAIKFIRSSVQKAANFDIKSLSPIEHSDRCFVPAMFVAAENDQFVLPRHSQAIYEKYGGDKNLVMVEGDHNSPRPRYLYDSVAIFLQQTLQLPSTWMLPGCENYVRRLPWVPSSLTSAAQQHPQRSILPTTAATTSGSGAVSGSDRSRLQEYIQRQRQSQDNAATSATVARKPLMYESDSDCEREVDSKDDGHDDISSLMTPGIVNSNGLTDAETELMMLEMMDEDEQIALALAQSMAENNPMRDATNLSSGTSSQIKSMDEVHATQNAGEIAMQTNVEQSLFTLLGGAKPSSKGSANNNVNIATKDSVSSSTSTPSSTVSNTSSSSTLQASQKPHPRPLSKTKSHSHGHHHEAPTYVVHEHTPSTSALPISPTAKNAAEMLLRQVQSPSKPRVFFPDNEEGTTSPRSSHSYSAPVPMFPTTSMPSPSANTAKSAHHLGTASSFHTYHNVFDSIEIDQPLRRASASVDSSSAGSTGARGISIDASGTSHRPSLASASQILSMADPFDDWEEVEVEYVDELGNKQTKRIRRKKKDEFADDNDEPIGASEIVGMEETMEELSQSTGWEDPNEDETGFFINKNRSNSSLSSASISRTNSNAPSPVVPSQNILHLSPNEDTAGSSSAPTVVVPPVTQPVRQHSASIAEELLLGGDEDD